MRKNLREDAMTGRDRWYRFLDLCHAHGKVTAIVVALGVGFIVGLIVR